jgi:glycosyltransferase involved in cell wall biosynthesis
VKKIGLFLNTDPAEGGTFQYNQMMLDAVAALPRERFETVLCCTSESWVDYAQRCQLPHFLVRSGFWGRAAGLIWTRMRLPIAPWRAISPLLHPIAKALLQAQCDLWIFPYPTARSFEAPVPALVSIHDLMHRYESRFPESGSRWESWAREANLRSICRWSRGVLVDSEVGRSQVHECYGMPLEKISVLPYIAPAYIHSAGTPADFDARYRLPAKFIFYPAQFWEHKNHRSLIEALRLLKGEIPDLKLVLAGAPKNAYDSVLRLVQESGLSQDVSFLGYVADRDMPELYRRARALVMPTFYGPTNIPPLEAFAAGCPVAVSGIYAMPEQVGDAALLFNPESVAEIADCIRRLWLDDALCAELAQRGRKRAQAWGARQFNARLLDIVEEVVREPAAAVAGNVAG